MKNWIIMPTYDCRELTRQAIDTCLKQDCGRVQVLAVDSASQDGTAQLLRSLYPGVQSITVPRAAGVSYAWNIALSYVFGQGSPFALVVNSDVRLRPDTFSRLREDRGLFVTCVGSSSGAQFPGGAPSGERRPHPDFSCFFIRRECWERVGQFDEDMRIYCSDGDYHLRMHKAGIKAYCLDLPFYHYASGTLKQAKAEDKQRIMGQADKDREAFEQKWGCRMGTSAYYQLFREGLDGKDDSL